MARDSGHNFYFRNMKAESDKSRKIREGRTAGKIVKSIDQLVCKTHLKSKFKKDQALELTYLEKKVKINTYICSICEDKNSEKPTTAYDCTASCKGIVYGKPKIRLRIRSRDLVVLNIGKDKKEYTCSVCNQYLGGIPLEKQRKIN